MVHDDTFEEKEGVVIFTKIEKYTTYTCNIGGFNLRLDWRDGDQWNGQKFWLKCKNMEPDVPEWSQPAWPTCAAGM